MAHGGKRIRAGRKKGSPNKATSARQALVTASGATPLDIMIKNMRIADAMADAAEKAAITFAREALSQLDGQELLNALIAEGKKIIGLRSFAQDCARDAAPYVHPKLAQLTHKGDQDNPVRAVVEIAFVAPQ